MKGQHAFVTIAMMIVFGLIAYVNRGHLIIEATNKKQKSFMMNTRGKVMPSYNKGADTPDTIDDQENESKAQFLKSPKCSHYVELVNRELVIRVIPKNKTISPQQVVDLFCSDNNKKELAKIIQGSKFRIIKALYNNKHKDKEDKKKWSTIKDFYLENKNLVENNNINYEKKWKRMKALYDKNKKIVKKKIINNEKEWKRIKNNKKKEWKRIKALYNKQNDKQNTKKWKWDRNHRFNEQCLIAHKQLVLTEEWTLLAEISSQAACQPAILKDVSKKMRHAVQQD